MVRRLLHISDLGSSRETPRAQGGHGKKPTESRQKQQRAGEAAGLGAQFEPC